MVKKTVRKVRLNLQSSVTLDREGAREVPGLTLEGLLAGTRKVGGIAHYVLWEAKVVEDEDKTVSMNGHVEVPVSRVLFLQVDP